jgi:hypothetical protein
MKIENLQFNKVEADLESKPEKNNSFIELENPKVDNFDLTQEVIKSKIEDTQEIQKVRQEIASVPKNETAPMVQEKTVDLVEQKPGWFASKLDTAKRYLKVATLGAGVFMGANKLEAGNINQGGKDRIIDNTEQIPSTEKTNPNLENKNEKSIDGGNLAEVIVYGRKKYEEEFLRQEENIKKYQVDLEKYKKDSAGWVKANESYRDSLKLYEVSTKQLNKFYKLVDFYKDSGQRLTGDEVIALNKQIEDFWKKDGTFGHVRSGDIEKVPYSDKRQGYGSFNLSKPEEGRYWADERDEKAEDFVERTKNDAIKPKFVPIQMAGTDYGEFGKDKYNYRAIYDKPKGGLKDSPIRPELPKTEKIKYDSKYEDLSMRSLWPTILKKNPNEKIGTLKVLDPFFKEGFTIDEAMSFPQEIKDKYNIDYIYNQIHGKK